MTLITPDGTKITVNGSTNDINAAGPWKFIATAANVEVYASIDGRFYDKAGSDATSNRAGTITKDVNGVLGYNPVSRLTFLGGKNIDSLVTDPVSGNPLFTTVTKLSTKVSGVGTGITDLVYDLDLTDTSLLPGAFQITSSVQDGEPLARLSNVSIDAAGRIVGVYGSGKQIYVGQVVLADFTAFEELIPVGKNAFAPSAASGTESDAYGVVIGRAGTGPFGEIKSQALESSNVDLANELVRLMIMQRSYTANSQSMKAVDSTLRDMLDIMR
jgi:flagellar hook protein FlgE